MKMKISELREAIERVLIENEPIEQKSFLKDLKQGDTIEIYIVDEPRSMPIYATPKPEGNFNKRHWVTIRSIEPTDITNERIPLADMMIKTAQNQYVYFFKTDEETKFSLLTETALEHILRSILREISSKS